MRAGVTKEELIKSLEQTLKLTRAGVSKLELADEDTVIVFFNDGYHKAINIACNSGIAIISDVARKTIG